MVKFSLYLNRRVFVMAKRMSRAMSAYITAGCTDEYIDEKSLEGLIKKAKIYRLILAFAVGILHTIQMKLPRKYQNQKAQPSLCTKRKPFSIRCVLK